MTPSETPLPRPSPTAIFRAMADGGVLFSSDSEVYFGLNPVGTIIWEALPTADTVEGLCRNLSERYKDVPAEVLAKDVRNFLRDLLASGLVVAADGGSASAPDAGRAP